MIFSSVTYRYTHKRKRESTDFSNGFSSTITSHLDIKKSKPRHQPSKPLMVRAYIDYSAVPRGSQQYLPHVITHCIIAAIKAQLVYVLKILIIRLWLSYRGLCVGCEITVLDTQLYLILTIRGCDTNSHPKVYQSIQTYI